MEIFNLDNLKAELAAAEVEPSPDGSSRRVFLGTVMDLMPSGKFYTPWACSNVSDEEAEEDEAWREQAEEELGSIGAVLESGEGDPCDLFAVQYVEEENEDA